VADDGRVAEEGRKARERDIRGWRAREVLVTDAGEARDDALERRAGIYEAAEALTNGDGAVQVETYAHRTDLDDAVRGRIESGRLEVQRDEVDRDGFELFSSA